MKRLVAACLLGLYLAACSVFTHENMSRLQAAELAACFIAHAFLTDSQAIAVACRVGPEFTSMIDAIVGEHKAGIEREMHNAGTCKPTLAGDVPMQSAW
jgi:hypothetical protein